MRGRIAKLLNAGGNSAGDQGHPRLARAFYQASTLIDSSWSIPWYNLGLKANYRGDWIESLVTNQRAALLDPADEAAWWNLAIAATALHDWSEARRAWHAIEIETDQSDGEVSTPPVQACVRINPLRSEPGSGEVVWGLRLDPARIRILNVPLPQSKRRYGDILLNDGAPNGSRTSGSREFPVFDELALWRTSPYSTFRLNVSATDPSAIKVLEKLCEEGNIGVENWGTVRSLCAVCSRGNPGPHQCTAPSDEDDHLDYGFAAVSREALEEVPELWGAECRSARFGEPTLELMAPS